MIMPQWNISGSSKDWTMKLKLSVAIEDNGTVRGMKCHNLQGLVCALEVCAQEVCALDLCQVMMIYNNNLQ